MAKSAAKLKLVKDALESFRENGRRFREIKNLILELNAEKKDLQGGLEDYTKEHGEPDANKGDDKFIFIDNGSKWQWQVIRTSVLNEEAAVVKVEELKADTRSSKKKTFLDGLLMQKTVINQEVYESFKKVGSIPEELIEVYETEKVQTRFNHWFVDKIKCAACGSVVQRAHKFCFECGEKVVLPE